MSVSLTEQGIEPRTRRSAGGGGGKDSTSKALGRFKNLTKGEVGGAPRRGVGDNIERLEPLTRAGLLLSTFIYFA